MSAKFADTWDEQMLIRANEATLEHDAVELLLELNLEHLVWKTPMDTTRVRAILETKFGAEGWTRIQTQADKLTERKLTGYNTAKPPTILTVTATNNNTAAAAAAAAST